MDVSPELSDSILKLRGILTKRIELIDILIGILIQHPSFAEFDEDFRNVPVAIATVMPLMLQAAGASTNTLVKIAEPGLQTRDCYPIARSIVEMAVNISYIVAAGPEAAERALRHAREKAAADEHRESRIGEQVIRLQRVGDDSDIEKKKSKEDLGFVSRQGREKGWVDLSIDQRIEIAGRGLGEVVLTMLHGARFMIYRHSSEILHGTFFSAAYFFGITQGHANDSSQALEFAGSQLEMILVAVDSALHAILQAFHVKYGFCVVYGFSKELTKVRCEIVLKRNSGSRQSKSERRMPDLFRVEGGHGRT